jgi:hypothetical protein
MRFRHLQRTLVSLVLVASPIVHATTASASSPLPGETSCTANEAVQTTVGGVVIKAGQVTDDLGTGEQGGVPDPITSADTKWDVFAPTAGDAYSVAPNGAWTTVPDANWINTSTTNASHGTGGTVGVLTEGLTSIGGVGLPSGPVSLASTATFRTEFTLPSRFQQAVLNLQYAADNGVTFRLNGLAIGGYDTGSATSTAFNQLHTLAYAGPQLHSGTNVLDAVVTDYGVATGLLVRGSATACELLLVGPGDCVAVEGQRAVLYSPAPVDVGTGSHGYVQDALHTRDSKWFYGAQGAYSIPTNGAWYGQSGTNNWINWQDTDWSSGFPYPPRTYTLTFTVPAGATWVDLDLRYAADNGVTFRLNGVPIGSYSTTGSDPSAFKQLHTIHVTDVTSVVAGVNTLEAIVNDFGGYTGLLVEGSLSACQARVGAGPQTVTDILNRVV